MKKNFFLISILLFASTGCEREPKFGKEAFAANRPCVESKFQCLPESIDPEYQMRWENFEMTNREQLDPADSGAQARARLMAWMDEIIEDIENQFPGYWNNVDKATRVAWIDAAFDKSDEWGFNNSKGEAVLLIDILARMGLDFDDQAGNTQLVEFLLDGSLLSSSARLVETRDYIDWVLFERTHTQAGDEISLWGLAEILKVMPMPSKIPPELPRRRGD